MHYISRICNYCAGPGRSLCITFLDLLNTATILYYNIRICDHSDGRHLYCIISTIVIFQSQLSLLTYSQDDQMKEGRRRNPCKESGVEEEKLKLDNKLKGMAKL